MVWMCACLKVQGANWQCNNNITTNDVLIPIQCAFTLYITTRKRLCHWILLTFVMRNYVYIQQVLRYFFAHSTCFEYGCASHHSPSVCFSESRRKNVTMFVSISSIPHWSLINTASQFIRLIGVSIGFAPTTKSILAYTL